METVFTKPKLGTVTITIDLDAFRDYVEKTSRENDGSLESSSGWTPSTFDEGVDGSPIYDAETGGLKSLLNQISEIMHDNHTDTDYNDIFTSEDDSDD